MYSACKIRWKVDPQAAQVLDEQSKIVNWLYNHLLEHANELRVRYREKQEPEIGHELYSKWGLRNLVPGLKKEYPFLHKVYSAPLVNAALRLTRAIRHYQESKQGEIQGIFVQWPEFHKWSLAWFSLEYESPWVGYRLNGRMLTVVLGKDSEGKRMSVVAPLAERFPAQWRDKVKRLLIVKQSGQYFAIFTIERPEPVRNEPRFPKVIAFDPNHKNFAYGVSNTGIAVEIENLKPLRQLDARVDDLKAKRDRCQRKAQPTTKSPPDETRSKTWSPSRRWKFLNRQLDKAYQKRHDVTKTFLFTLASYLCHNYDVIGIGDYAPKGFGVNRKMRHSMNNASLIRRFKDTVAWVALKSGKVYVEYAEPGTTRTCHVCGFVVEGGISPNIRRWQCPQCQTEHHRDENAAQNGLVRTLEKIGLPCSGHTPVVITARWIWRVTPSGVVTFRDGETDSSEVGESISDESPTKD